MKTAFALSLLLVTTPFATGNDFFETKIRPVLVKHCYECHSAEAGKSKGGLLLDTREGIRTGGDTGPAVVPGDLEKSLLIAAIRWHDPDTGMPPEKKGGKLPDSIIADIEAWVKAGAEDPRDGKTTAKKYDGMNAKDWWAYQPLTKPKVPTIKNEAWAKTDIDRFILAELEAKGLEPVARADPRARRQGGPNVSKRADSGLLTDLKSRGLLQDTLVIWGGEFGRTPHAEGQDGRDHNVGASTMWMAGCGVKAGARYGVTDDYGYDAIDGKVSIHDWHATILHLLGLDHEKLTYRHAGRDFRLTDVHGRMVKEIIA